MDLQSRTILESVLALPTMSFHETAVSTFVKWYAAALSLDVREDAAGNILVRYAGGGRNRPSVTFAAHMDHPGFEVLSARGNRAVVAQWGKVNLRVVGGAAVLFQGAEGPVRGRLAKKPLPRKHEGRATFACSIRGRLAAGDFGAFDLTRVRFANGKIHALAADNLISVAAILDLMTRFVRGGAKVNVSGLFTRGEEAGFLGAFAAMESKLIPRKDPLVVLECSSAAGGNVVIGKGPVVRAGDLASTYDPEVEVWIHEVASAILAGRAPRKGAKGFSYQRALLQGGRCEACVYIAEGYATGGIALPLGNYHNQGKRGAAAEFVGAADYANLLQLIAALSHRPFARGVMAQKVAPIRAHYRGLKGKLRRSA